MVTTKLIFGHMIMSLSNRELKILYISTMFDHCGDSLVENNLRCTNVSMH